jgi:hypothetical protein
MHKAAQNQPPTLAIPASASAVPVPPQRPLQTSLQPTSPSLIQHIQHNSPTALLSEKPGTQLSRGRQLNQPLCMEGANAQQSVVSSALDSEISLCERDLLSGAANISNGSENSTFEPSSLGDQHQLGGAGITEQMRSQFERFGGLFLDRLTDSITSAGSCDQTAGGQGTTT